MGTIVKRRRDNGTAAYMAKIILKRKGKIIHRETKTFDRRPAAAAWIARTEDELSRPVQLDSTGAPLLSNLGFTRRTSQRRTNELLN